MFNAKLYQNGFTMGRPGKNSAPAKRGEVTGWTSATARRNTKFLYSVDIEQLSGFGYAFTLTLPACPSTSEDWQRLRKYFFERLKRAVKLLRLHWVTEWTRRGVPHLHGVVYVEEELKQDGLIIAKVWERLTFDRDIFVSLSAQDVKPIKTVRGWLEYLAKHASRGIQHYQRQGKPAGWEKTGRVWGHVGHWPTVTPVEVSLAPREAFRLRRLADAYLISKARSRGDKARLNYLRQRRRISTERWESSTRGISDWIPEQVSLGLLTLILDQVED